MKVHAARLGALPAIAILVTAVSFGATHLALAQAPPVTAARVKLAEEYLAASGAAQRFDIVLPSMIKQMAASFAKLRPDKSAEIEAVMSELTTMMVGRRAELIAEVAHFYAETLTEEELQGLLAFTRSPLGRRLAELQPTLTQGSMLIGQRWGMRIGGEIEKTARAELKRRGIDL